MSCRWVRMPEDSGRIIPKFWNEKEMSNGMLRISLPLVASLVTVGRAAGRAGR